MTRLKDTLPRPIPAHRKRSGVAPNPVLLSQKEVQKRKTFMASWIKAFSFYVLQNYVTFAPTKRILYKSPLPFVSLYRINLGPCTENHSH